MSKNETGFPLNYDIELNHPSIKDRTKIDTLDASLRKYLRKYGWASVSFSIKQAITAAKEGKLSEDSEKEINQILQDLTSMLYNCSNVINK